MKYFFETGRNFDLSRAEIANFGEIIFENREKNFLILQNLRFENPRELPKLPAQILLDRLGGAIRIAEIFPENFENLKKIAAKIFREIEKKKWENRPKIAVADFSDEKILTEILTILKKNGEKNWRLENFYGKKNLENLSSGEIFDRKILRSGAEFLLFKFEKKWKIAKTIAIQNLKNYVLRDRRKPFRDAKNGMLPPKIAQILLNLAAPKFSEKIFDPFCGSATIAIEAAIAGFCSQNSDFSEKILAGGKKNFEFCAEKFRFKKNCGEFFLADATKINFKNFRGPIVTEGFLGKNFEQSPKIFEIENESQKILKMWEKIFQNLKNSKIKKVVFCLPAWNFRGKKISIREKLFAKFSKNFYCAENFFCEREQSFVAREICVASGVAQR